MSQERRFAAILRQASPADVISLFTNADQAVIKRVARRLGCEYTVGEPTHEEVGRLIQGCLALKRETYLEEVMLALQKPVANTAEDTLGEAFDDPSADDLARLTPILVEKHGRLATSVYYCFVIHLDSDAASLLEEFFAPGAIFEVNEDQSPSVPLIRPVSRLVDEEKRARRKERRAKRKASIFSAPPAMFRRRHKAPRPGIKEEPPPRQADRTEATPSQIPIKKLEHPHVHTDGTLSTTHDLVGAVVQAYAPYQVGNPNRGGKIRPCVVIAVSEDWFLVRLVFSRPWRYAGNWRSVRLDDWRLAGLKNQSFVSTERRTVWRDRAEVVGRLTTKDWNRICRGEVNSEGNL